MQIIIELRLGYAAPARGGRRDSSVHLVIAKPQFAFQMRKSPMSFFLDTMAQNFTLARAAARPFEHSWLPKTKDFCLESFPYFVKNSIFGYIRIIYYEVFKPEGYNGEEAAVPYSS